MAPVRDPQFSDEYYAERESRLRALLPLAREALAEEPHRWFEEYVDYGEYGLAVEVATDAIPDDAQASAVQLATALLTEADVMGLDAAATRLRQITSG
jgi:hypothetical protein